MTAITLLFYPANQPNATWLDHFVAWIDGGKFSHVEIVQSIEGDTIQTVGCHAIRGGVSKGTYTTPYDQVELVTVDAYSPSMQSIIKGTMGAPYSYLGALRTVFNWLPKPSKGWCCSTWVADVLWLRDADLWGVQSLYQWAKNNEVKK